MKIGKSIIVKPFKYNNETYNDIDDSLSRIFKTSHVVRNNDYYIITNYDEFNYIDINFNEVIKLPNNYTTKIILGNKRYYNIFKEDGEWTDSKGKEYPNISNHHLFLIEDSNGNLLFKKYQDEKYQILTMSIWTDIIEDIDIIFTTIRKDKFSFPVPNSTDYAWISPYWYDTIENLDEWYENNKKNLYLLSYMASRNISDILSCNSKNDWELLSDDIFFR